MSDTNRRQHEQPDQTSETLWAPLTSDAYAVGPVRNPADTDQGIVYLWRVGTASENVSNFTPAEARELAARLVRAADAAEQLEPGRLFSHPEGDGYPS
ncbi:hypothetical protein [Frigoribacterium salinisoli]